MNPELFAPRARKFFRLAAALLGASVVTMGSLHAQTNWNSAAVTTADRYTTGVSTTTTWSDTTAWNEGTVANGAGLSVTLEPRHTIGTTSAAMTVTVDGTYTVGTLTSRTNNSELRFTGTGKLIFDNTIGGVAGKSFWNATSRLTRITNLRGDLFVDFQMNNDLEIRFGVARAEEATVGRIGNVISGTGKLILSLAQNDPLTTRLIKIGNGTTANTYQGGTEIRHVVNTTYGTSHGTTANTLLVNAVSTGAFGTGDVLLNSQGLNATAVTALNITTGGLQLVLTADNSMGATAVLTQSGNGAGTVYLGATSQTIGGLISAGSNKRIQTNTGALTINTAADRSYLGSIVGSGSVTIGGTHTQTFGGANTYTGVTTLKAGTLSVAVIGNGEDLTSNLSAATSAAANLVFAGGTLKYTGVDASTNRNFTINAGKTAIVEVGANTLTFTGASIATTGALTKTGAGTLTLSGANLHTGLTKVEAGTLALGATGSLASTQINIALGATLDGSAVTGGFTLASGQTLSGNGGVTGALTVANGGTLAAGNSIGTLTFDDGLEVNGTLDVELSGNLADLYNVTGLLALGANSTVNFSILEALTGTVYIFATYDTWNNVAFGTVNGAPAGWTVNYQYNDGVSSNNFALVAVPEPGAIALGILGGALVFSRRRRSA